MGYLELADCFVGAFRSVCALHADRRSFKRDHVMSSSHQRTRASRETKISTCLVLLALSTLFVAASCDSAGEKGPVEPAPQVEISRLHAQGRDIVNEQGEVKTLRGVNLGGWLFHETWISAVDYTLSGRIHVLGAEAGIGEDVDAALRIVGPAEGDGWLAAFRTAVEGRVGAEATDALLDEVARYPSIYDDSDLPLRLLLEDRFGTAGRDDLLDIFWGAWIREADIEWISQQGFNVVRVPIGYRNLITVSDREPLTALPWNERAFARVDELLSWCERYGVYAVLDIQEAPGGQNDYSGPPRLYEDPLMQALTVDLWEEISRRYARRNVVAAYSLLAEPFGAPSPRARDDMYDTLIRALRGQGDDHLLVIHDGFFGLQTLPRPLDRGWEGVVYSTHLFEFGVNSLPGYQLLALLYDLVFNRAQGQQDVPYYIGSFSTMKDADYAYEAATLLLDLYKRSGWSWSLWTYKKIDDPIEALLFGTSTSWGLKGRLRSALDRPDVYRDDEQTLRRKFAAYADQVIAPNERLLEVLVGDGTQ